ncbi:MAG: hypothetical protein LBR79_06400 [Oscillospiraceae bacterium]|nr:hypothetical protein [Oscillospiraceae bacterium]
MKNGHISNHCPHHRMRRSCLKIVKIPSFPSHHGWGKKYYQLIWNTTENVILFTFSPPPKAWGKLKRRCFKKFLL